MSKIILVGSTILLGLLSGDPALAYFWSDFGINSPAKPGGYAKSFVSIDGWPDWIGRLEEYLPPAIVSAGGAAKDDGWPGWIGRIDGN